MTDQIIRKERQNAMKPASIVALMKANHSKAELRAPVDLETVCELLDDLLEIVAINKLVGVIERQATTLRDQESVIRGLSIRVAVIEAEAGYEAVGFDKDQKKLKVRAINRRAA